MNRMETQRILDRIRHAVVDTLKREYTTGDELAVLSRLSADELAAPVREAFVEAARNRNRQQEFERNGPSIPTTVRDWQLYSSHTDAAQAAAELHLAACTAKAAILMAVDSTQSRDYASRRIGDAYSEYIAPVMAKWSKTGASDTEPRNVAAQFLVDVVKHLFGIPRSEWTDLGDHI